MTNKTINLTFIDNESHGYIKLSKYDLQGFGIGIKEFSKYSYYNPDNACYYFEEDCDGLKLWNSLKSKGYMLLSSWRTHTGIKFLQKLSNNQ